MRMNLSDREKQLEDARKRMVKIQLAGRGIRDSRVLAAMSEIPRHIFVSKSLENRAYDDNPLSIGFGQTISQPYMVAIMTELLGLEGRERVLEIGTGCGYQTAILMRLCRKVFTIERVEALSIEAQKNISGLEMNNVCFKVGDGTLGWNQEAPFDCILVTAGCPVVPETLVEQLAENGRLVIPVGDRFSQTLKRLTKNKEKLKTENFTACRFVDLIGQYGWPD